YWRQPEDGVNRTRLHHDLATHRALSADLARARTAGRFSLLAEHDVWTVGRDGEGFAVRALERGDVGTAGQRLVQARRLVLAPGAHDRQIPFPGWDLPGVLTAGGAQALVKAHGVVPGQRVVVAGTGPFLLPVAVALADAGARVVGVHEAASVTGWLPGLPSVARNPAKLLEGGGYAATLARRRIPVHTRSAVVAAHGDDAVAAVTVARLDRAGHVVAGSEQRIAVDAVAVGWGFVPRLELLLALGCATHVDVDGSLVVRADERQETTVPGVFAAGEACGVGGSALAVVEGRLAGLAAAGVQDERTQRLVHRRDRLRAFAVAMHRAHPVPPFWRERLEPSTIVCRCEEVTTERLRDAVDRSGASDGRSAKLLSRVGMGWCQGRFCGFAASCLVSEWTGESYDPSGTAERPLAVPVPLAALAADDESPR
ncbi:MAG TPA: FAD-dependent oxidoreductase, partial [Motilibacteraceae bacterium]|nr:FAD-dependent oxidoreductase [Motilibacteraceae bacterium]